jgi:hypothetical protein
MIAKRHDQQLADALFQAHALEHALDLGIDTFCRAGRRRRW